MEKERELSWLMVLLKIFVLAGAFSTLAIALLITLLVLRLLLGR